jgi:hypothetical protein
VTKTAQTERRTRRTRKSCFKSMAALQKFVKDK